MISTWLQLDEHIVFQSPSGVLGVSREAYLAGQPMTTEVSVPFRGFRGLQVPPSRLRPTRRPRPFQSPSGVLGVSRNGCNQGNPPRCHPVSVPFRGFRGLQAIIRLIWQRRTLRVSVPFRGFRGLQATRLGAQRRNRFRVSVPFRGFRGLQGLAPLFLEPRIECFSPLPGF